MKKSLYEFTFQHPNVAEVTWEYDHCIDDKDAQYIAKKRATELRYKLVQIKKY